MFGQRNGALPILAVKFSRRSVTKPRNHPLVAVGVVIGLASVRPKAPDWLAVRFLGVLDYKTEKSSIGSSGW